MKIEIITSNHNQINENDFGSQLVCEDVEKAIKAMGYTVRISQCNTHHDLQSVVQRRPDLVVLTAKSILIESNEIFFAQYFADHHIIFTGSDKQALNFDTDKALAKQHLAKLGINTAHFFTALPNQFSNETQLPFGFPLFVKPLGEADGKGIDHQSVVKNFAEYQFKVSALYEKFKQPILVEEFLNGREFTVSVIKDDLGKMILSAIELIPQITEGSVRILGDSSMIYNTELKKISDEKEIHGIKALAASSFEGLGACGFGRIDIKMDASGKCYFMEANLIPGMNRHTSFFPRACLMDNDLSYEDVIKHMISETICRARTHKNLNNLFDSLKEGINIHDDKLSPN
ncbi:hypothetical protein [Marinicellulosiphila megalodicopiae]|uniref:hypothetical protein n=1 Tax=Marinicellulosiphila megalodicopiae TaxID=2724896 RepID=UPI003BAF8F3B